MSDTSNASGLTALGGQTQYRYEDPVPSQLESFSNQHPDSLSVVGLDCLEFTSLCPITGQPDFARLHIHYVPASRCVESKSLKLYLGAYRNHGSFHEDCINRIADDLCTSIGPRYLRVFGDFSVRGGIAIRPLAIRTAAGLSAEEEARCVGLLAHHDALMRIP
jgi:7-cyano-7-deazaguanine reductase